jgi:hypothetical protein
VVLTAGHCTGDTAQSPATNVFVSFNTDLPLDLLQPGISPAEKAARAANYITGTAQPDPYWTGKLLDAPVTTKWPGGRLLRRLRRTGVPRSVRGV